MIPDGYKVIILIRDEKSRAYFLELKKPFFVKILQFFDADPG
jgi:hypothetical protein